MDCKWCGKRFGPDFFEESFWYHNSKDYYMFRRIGWLLVEHCVKYHPKEVPKRFKTRVVFDGVKGYLKAFIKDLLWFPIKIIALAWHVITICIRAIDELFLGRLG